MREKYCSIDNSFGLFIVHCHLSILILFSIHIHGSFFSCIFFVSTVRDEDKQITLWQSDKHIYVRKMFFSHLWISRGRRDLLNHLPLTSLPRESRFRQYNSVKLCIE